MEELLTKSEELRNVRVALLNVLEDTDDLRKEAVDERNKTMTIIENLNDGVILLNKNNQVEIINSPALEVLNIKREGVLGIPFANLLDKEELAEIKKAIIDEKDHKKIKDIYREEFSTLKDRHVEITSVLLRDELEEKGFLIVIHDVTKEKLVERMKTEFVSVAAHQLRTPLSAIKWTVRMILDGDVGSINEEQKELLEKTYISNERMIRLINDLLNVSRIEEGRLLYNQEEVQIEDVLEGVVNASQEILRNKNIKLKVEKKELPKVIIDKEKMGLVIQNLLENAVKYTHQGGKIKISLDNDEKNVIFKIEDSGVGIPKDQQDRIFTKFFRAENVTRMETDGTGLGLYTTKNIIQAHKGEIWFESEENKGTTFYFKIPISNK